MKRTIAKVWLTLAGVGLAALMVAAAVSFIEVRVFLGCAVFCGVSIWAMDVLGW